jgi:Glutathione S-transferase, N-terminal domain
LKLYVCYGTWKPAPWRPGGKHPCGAAYHALKDAGYKPEVKLSYGLGVFPSAVNNLTAGRREVKELTGNYWVPALVTDNGTVIQGSREIADWAAAHPAGSASAPPADAASPEASAGAATTEAAAGP